MAWTRWTKGMDDFIRANYKLLKDDEIAERMNSLLRTRLDAKVVRYRRISLGLTKGPNDTRNARRGC